QPDPGDGSEIFPSTALGPGYRNRAAMAGVVPLDAAYDQRFYAPTGDQIQKRVASISEAVRARLGEPLHLSYGPSEPEKLDVYRARKPNAPIFLFVHGFRGVAARREIMRIPPKCSSTPARISLRSTSSTSSRQAATFARWPPKCEAPLPGSTRMPPPSAPLRTGSTSAAVPPARI